MNDHYFSVSQSRKLKQSQIHVFLLGYFNLVRIILDQDVKCTGNLN